MKQPGGELQETLAELDDRVVVDYLIKNSESFICNVCAVETIRIPHSVHGTVSLIERHMARTRNYIHALEENMVLSMERAAANEGLFYRLLYLQRSLTAASSLDDMLMRFHRWTRDLGLAGTNLHLFPDRWRLGALSNYTHLTLSCQSFEPLHVRRLGQEQYYLGPFNGPELLVALPEAKAVGSVAISVLGSDASLGVVLPISRDANYYQQGQGT